jgi:outer membrane lipoprotein-sorting protein
MARWQRWAVVAALVAVLVSLPSVIAHLPAGHSETTAGQLLSKIKSSDRVGYSGYGEATGGLALPVTDQFNSIADLFGGTSQLRVWWRGPQQWRVDTIAATGEQDLHHDSSGTWQWDYESNTATRIGNSDATVRLPRADDLLAPTLGRRLLSQAQPTEVTRLANRRIAGRDTAGLRLTPSESQSTISHVDVWALPSSGLTLAVDVYGRGSSATVMTSTMLDLSTSVPGAATIAFSPPDGAKIRVAQNNDIVTAIDQFGRTRTPDQLAGLDRQSATGLGGVGVYGHGVTLLVALPLSSRLAGSFTRQLTDAVGASTADAGTALGVGPVNLLLTTRRANGSAWLLVGTVDAATLTQAASALPEVFGSR